ncbi:FAD-binding oxidoreductase [Corynebacterium aquatimens]|uniref:NAD(P)/FAD-dependent oxidoreductase n=1 Tax=Corynebacterium TaxID=1716 RepID=UPI001F45A5CE|nr:MULTISPECIES: FAD-dependent oxidoreductase [Corynebacterium]QYH19629.1 FAD-binding oxidoreductase [Corynebacterium aquatimens]UIZ91383.1 FAD-binding oxidoreductase [Corynebacterium sp. CNCTC7651]
MTTALVIGAGMTGLATAWHLQEYGYDVEVVDRVGVAGGSSWGNAGWLAPGKTIPLSNSSLWMYGPTALFDKHAALDVPVRVDAKLWAFVAQFMAHATSRAWDTTMKGLTPADLAALKAFDELEAGGVDAESIEAPFIVGFETEALAGGFLKEVEGAKRHGQDIPFRKVSLEEARQDAPMLTEKVGAIYRMEGQRYIEPGPYCEAIADSIEARGGTITSGVEVVEVQSTRKPAVKLSTGEWLNPDVVVIATGAWMPKLAKDLGVTTMIQAGRGYSFSVETEQPATCPVYLPEQKVACTPYQGRFRVAGTMEFRGPDEPFQPGRIKSIIHTTTPMFRGVDWDSRQDEWVGSRPVTPDGLPLVGATKAPNVYVNGGHGMWGVVLGPISGKMLAKEIATGEVDPILKPFDPLRGHFVGI